MDFSGLAKVHTLPFVVPNFGASEVIDRLVVVLSVVTQKVMVRNSWARLTGRVLFHVR